MANFYGATGLIGGASGDLDKIDGASLVNGDGAFVITSTYAYLYYLNATSGAVEASPDVISPDANAGTKRWILVNVFSPVYQFDYVGVNDASRTNTALTTDYIVAFTALTAARGYQISSEDIAQSGRIFHVKDAAGAAGTYNITISTEGAELIDGAATYVLNNDYEAVTLFSNGSHLFIL
jgi:hypothetical protein